MHSIYMNTAEVASYLRFVDADGHLQPNAREQALHFIESARIPKKRRGNSVLVHRDHVESALSSFDGKYHPKVTSVRRMA